MLQLPIYVRLDHMLVGKKGDQAPLPSARVLFVEIAVGEVQATIRSLQGAASCNRAKLQKMVGLAA